MKGRGQRLPSLFPPAALAFSAGAASLLLELLWMRALSIEVGSPLTAFTIVLCSFLGGLAVGAAIFGRVADRSAEPLLLFAALQALIGVVGLLSSLLTSGGGLTRAILLALSLSPEQSLFAPARVLFSGASVFLPAVPMGGTLPLLLMMRAPGGRTPWWCGVLAGSNAAGAAIGSVACGFVLLPSLGLTSSLVVAGLLSLATSSGAWLFHSTGPGPRPAKIRATAPRSGSLRSALGLTTGSKGVLMTLFATGLALTALEVVWTRIAKLAFGSSVQAGSVVLASVIAALAAGNGIGGRIATRSRSAASLLSTLALGSALGALATEPLLARLPLLAAFMHSVGEIPGGSYLNSRLLQSASMFFLAAVPCLMIGAAFPVGFRALIDTRPGARTVGSAAGLSSALFSAGNLAGAPLAYFGILGQAGSRSCFFAAMAVLASASVLPPTTRVRRAVGGAVAIVVLILGYAGRWDTAILSSGPFVYSDIYSAVARVSEGGSLTGALRSRGDLIFAREGPHALVTVRRRADGLLSLQVNGKTDASTGGDMKTQTLMAQLPLLFGPRSAAEGDVLVIGLGSGVTAASVLTHPVGSVSVMEISPEVVEAAELFSKVNRDALRDERLRLITGDARTRLLFSREHYDLIVSQPSNPWIAGEAILFTREFFELARSRLNPGGVMCQWLQGYGLEAGDFRSVVATFNDVFSDVSLWEASTAGGDFFS